MRCRRSSTASTAPSTRNSGRGAATPVPAAAPARAPRPDAPGQQREVQQREDQAAIRQAPKASGSTAISAVDDDIVGMAQEAIRPAPHQRRARGRVMIRVVQYGPRLAIDPEPADLQQRRKSARTARRSAASPRHQQQQRGEPGRMQRDDQRVMAARRCSTRAAPQQRRRVALRQRELGEPLRAPPAPRRWRRRSCRGRAARNSAVKPGPSAVSSMRPRHAVAQPRARARTARSTADMLP